MAKYLKEVPNLDDIVFETRNKEYGAYLLRKKYNRTVIVSLLIGIIIMSSAITAPFLNTKAFKNRQSHSERQVEIKMENLDQPNEQIAPPPPPPPPPADIVRQQKYIPPQVVDSLKPEDVKQLMTADQAQTDVKNEEVVEVAQQAKEEVQETETEPEPFMTVQEMPEPSGGMAGLFKFIADNVRYPETAKEYNIQGKVYVTFCVTSKGLIDKVSILKGVDPALDSEAVRIVKLFPPFKPGKQDGKPVPVWFHVYINFQLD